MTTSFLSRFPTLAARASEAQSRIEARREALEPQQLFLPGLEEFMRAMPNNIARSSLFAPLARGRKVYHNQVELVSRSDAIITYTGYQLDEYQADAWMQLIFEAKNAPLGKPVVINRSAFLKHIGRTTSGRDYQWLRQTMIAFTAATIVVEARKSCGRRKYLVGDLKAFHMLSDFEYDAESEAYTFTVDPRWQKVFSGNEYSLIDWDKRLEIAQGHDMAKALQRLAATSNNPVHRYPLDWLKEKLQYTSPIRKFRQSLLAAMRELARVGVIAGGRIELSTKGVEQAVWNKLT